MNKSEIKEQDYWNGKRLLITGGTSGLGLALARKADALGARVAIVARDPVRLAAAGSAIRPIRADVADKAATYRIAAEAIARLGGVDVLIHCAGYLGATPLRQLLDSDCEDLAAVLETNLVGPFRLTKALLPGMLLAGQGTAVMISSDAAVEAYPEWGAYSASKAAADQLFRVWGAELGSRGIRFLSLDPGEMDTPMHAAAVPGADRSALARPDDVAADLLQFLAAPVDFGRVRYSSNDWRKLCSR